MRAEVAIILEDRCQGDLLNVIHLLSFYTIVMNMVSKGILQFRIKPCCAVMLTVGDLVPSNEFCSSGSGSLEVQQLGDLSKCRVLQPVSPTMPRSSRVSLHWLHLLISKPGSRRSVDRKKYCSDMQ